MHVWWSWSWWYYACMVCNIATCHCQCWVGDGQDACTRQQLLLNNASGNAIWNRMRITVQLLLTQTVPADQHQHDKSAGLSKNNKTVNCAVRLHRCQCSLEWNTCLLFVDQILLFSWLKKYPQISCMNISMHLGASCMFSWWGYLTSGATPEM